MLSGRWLVGDCEKGRDGGEELDKKCSRQIGRRAEGW